MPTLGLQSPATEGKRQMRAISQQAFGGPERLEVVETDLPTLLSTEILVEVKAAGINPVDIAVRAGYYPILGEPPFVLGWDISGVVVEAAPAVTRFGRGDEVYGVPAFPAQAAGSGAYVAAAADELVLKPANIDHVHAAALPVVALTAWQGLV